MKKYKTLDIYYNHEILKYCFNIKTNKLINIYKDFLSFFFNKNQQQ